MGADLFIALVIYAFVSSVTPGPNNLMLLASGVNFGFRRSIPHMLGISLGFSLMLFVLGLGVGSLFEHYPPAQWALRIVGGAYMLWLAWKIANSGPVGEGTARGRPMTLLSAALFQWVNPKAWVMAIFAVATYTWPEAYFWSLCIVALTFGIVNLPSIGTWTLAGTALRLQLGRPKVLRAFNITMALLLVASLWPLLQG